MRLLYPRGPQRLTDAMQLRNILERRVKPELNTIYTEPPFIANGGYDCGWFCREHALHTYVLALILGRRVTIKIGDFTIHSATSEALTSVDSGADHAWCEIDGAVPIDLSMTFVHFKGQFPNLSFLYGTGSIGPFTSRYFTRNDDFMHDGAEGTFAISLLERQSVSPPLADILHEPYSFLQPPPVGAPRWTEIHGPDIFSKTSLHIYKLALGHIEPVSRSRSAKEVLKFIKSRYPNATNQIISNATNRV
jgi:hypothetical protein